MTDADATAHATRMLVHAVAACLNVPLSAARLGSRAGDADRRAGHVGAALLVALAAADLPGGDGVADLARVVNRWAADQPAVLAAAVRPDGGTEVAGG